MASIELYRFKVRDPVTAKWHQTQYRLDVETARERYGEGNYELIEWSKEVREIVGPLRLTASHLCRNAKGA